jgi:hypothetical protein
VIPNYSVLFKTVNQSESFIKTCRPDGQQTGFREYYKYPNVVVDDVGYIKLEVLQYSEGALPE